MSSPPAEKLNPQWLAFFRAVKRASATLDALEAADTDPVPIHSTDSDNPHATARG